MGAAQINFLQALFCAAVEAADPFAAVSINLPQKPKGKCIVVGAGKASALMAAAVDSCWPDVEVSGLVVTRYGHSVPAGRIRIIEAAHPVPDDASHRAAVEIAEAVRGLSNNDLVIALISGGGSSLLVSPAGGMTLSDKQHLNKALLSSGATIGEMNAVRKHFSAIKGGHLAKAAWPAKIVTLVISDVPGDDPRAVASGPTLGDPSTIEEVRDIIRRYNIDLTPAASAALAKSIETPKPDEVTGEVHVIVAPKYSLAAAVKVAKASGITPLVLGDSIEGEAKEVGKFLAGIARSVAQNGLPMPAPAVILSGGETTVSLPSLNSGRGGRNTETALALAIALDGVDRVWALAADTDGIDGTEDAAGAVICPDTLTRARTAGLNPIDYLLRHDSYSFFNALDDLVKTGPTKTNVNDFRAILIG